MESLISLVVLGVIYAAVYVVKRVAANGTDVDSESAMSEEFPPIETFEEDKNYCPPPITDVILRSNNVGPVARKKNADVDKANKSHRTTEDQPVVPAPGEVKGRRFRLSDKSEMKRALIYSEILNRRYQ